ncbi:hypothetical protein [Bacillus sp. T3]|uniref:hypothetical protein n=1 Tax=Bacillus sp. T3 TaxID=467262 RepID=UPI00298266E9|nr:hypothetical protein [Bacillus sp. T3]
MRVFVTYLVVNVISIPLHILFFFSALMGAINYQSDSPMKAFFDFLLYALILNLLNYILLLFYWVKDNKKLKKNNVISFIFFSIPIILLYITMGYFFG